MTGEGFPYAETEDDFNPSIDTKRSLKPEEVLRNAAQYKFYENQKRSF